ncbi:MULTISPECIES: LacI family DNA-binding transcriptional regulator [Sphingobacterium]|uniref:LacI family transcriptional regulator n=2 Tax=Sphingobacterium TaxID=28453 RepID=A0A420BFN0_SPHD1|nr:MULTISPECIES: LacI family DNA-binding transcriptional regulator [Sphingobacterium]MCS4225998.1 LacI family transcriptional regulator [Sphingobacterium sp. BIGb0165]RKE55493.1 LacI family transcriptional regulator [Sphingobacterium detergens]
MKNPIGIKDIAEMLGISVSTVSRAFRDTHDVNPTTRQKVLSLARELNFKPNKNAAALASGSTKNIGVVIPFITNYYFSTVISGIQEEAYEQDYNIILYVTNDSMAREQSLLENLSTSSLDGLLVSISSDSYINEHFERLMAKGLPIVFFDRVPNNIVASKVVQDDFAGAFQATRFLLENGANRIAHIAGPKDLKFTQQRLNGYIEALKQCNRPLEENLIVHSGFSQIHGSEDTTKLLALPQRPDAIFAANDRKAVGAILCIKKHNLRVGIDISVIGFTNDPICTVVEPNLTTIEEPAFDIGKRSCALLIRHIKNKDFEIQDIILPGKLVVRDSVINKIT